ncbi:helix-turn-helix domain-containing protein [Enterobacter roggenkampii]|uniref:helix-turn-helix domain-containing protein n=1 Tax=Enterobacter roggenkampii TaxID=1812935 RepID=UPI001F0AC8F8|nr:helix-turn-helix domain-containing protein [Enterobacter roggenkampii]WFC79313.1 helix-turn-helix domain-containing protein [Enterobacter roggenkampii]
MSMELMVKAMKVKVGNPLRKLVLLKLADNASDHGECWPSYQHIADQCEISKRSVMNHIDALCECGLVKKELRPGPKGNSSNVYRLDFSSAGYSLERSANRSLPSAGDSPHSAGDSPHSAGDSLGGSAGAAPRISHSFEPVNESVIEPKYNGSSDNDSEKYLSSKESYSNEFEQAWQAYPKRAGGNSKAAAWKAWRARIKDGVNTEAMLAGVNRYAGYVRATGSAGTKYVKQAATFFGPDRHFEESWQAPSGAVSGRPGGLPVSGFSEQDYGQSDCNW